MQQYLLSKAVLVASLTAIQNNMAYARKDFDLHPNTKKGQEAAMAVYAAAMQKAEQDLFSLAEGVRQYVQDASSIGKEYDKELFDKTLSITRSQLMKRLGLQPNILATVDLALMLVEANLKHFAHFSNLGTQCAIEDRMKGNTTAYGLDGEPNAKGRNECDHCPHKV